MELIGKQHQCLADMAKACIDRNSATEMEYQRIYNLGIDIIMASNDIIDVLRSVPFETADTNQAIQTFEFGINNVKNSISTIYILYQLSLKKKERDHASARPSITRWRRCRYHNQAKVPDKEVNDGIIRVLSETGDEAVHPGPGERSESFHVDGDKVS